MKTSRSRSCSCSFSYFFFFFFLFQEEGRSKKSYARYCNLVCKGKKDSTRQTSRQNFQEIRFKSTLEPSRFGASVGHDPPTTLPTLLYLKHSTVNQSAIPTNWYKLQFEA